ncbi:MULTISPECIES: PIG-L family deacetylase [Streptomyces]|uniref:PIG-L family deacetylase n=1 Tax=Streptomyces glycanivorans TaxID=3033808 RepID=A0ABY9JSE9_9ACTN|nr:MULTISPECIES: PIG-L family deacetylase [unclassified Streptomyces]WSQ82313.1 PIG-L family deacetylase [Streptomyces sp. NBC_01213]WLQ68937.1 PIG-L family deacetylase [Streptomyces sp. Alt3]WSQ89637.1 PIG-L family deacetylase [Streptomyces sp. NBC_01212]WSR11379.1 PIG-L family deacetylase [Streptomyces sp. NBC_01208]WSR52990.1 PIG-L family deacetylase [Streptomyces sp. NBC_01201]
MRRRTVITTAAAGLALSACSVPPPRRPDPAPDPAPGMPISTARRALLMQILAHPDDDLYFMNPDTRRVLDTGTPLVCVYLTAGEADGLNKVPGRPRPAPDKAAYSSARHQGLRQAYATLLGLEKFTPWQISVAELGDGHLAEVNTLAAGGRRVELVFIDTAMHTTRHRLGLPSLWHDRRLTLRTVVAEGSPLERPGAYTYDGLVDVLVGLLERHRPTVVHTLDPDPDIQHSTEAVRRRDSEQPGYSDHADHTAAACFAWAAMIRWVARSTRDGGQVPGFAVTSFRGYYNRHWPKNLPPTVLAEKAAHLVPYGGSPDWDCGNPSGCGDYNVGGDRPLTNRKGWVRSTRHRYPGVRAVVTTGPGGRLDAYAVVGLRLVRWREEEPAGGVWGPPVDLGGGPLAPALGSATAGDGTLLLFGLRFAGPRGHGAADEREIVLLAQSAPGSGFLAWRGLGNPSPGRDDGRRIGVPVAVTAPDGRTHLFVRNAEKGLSTRVREADRTWGEWRDLGGGEVQDGLSVVVDGTGRVHVHAAGHHAVHHWTQDAPGSELTARTQIDAGPVPGDAPTGLPAADGSVDLFYRAQARAVTTAVRDGVATDLVGFDGYGELAAAGPSLLGRTAGGQLQVLTGTRLSRRTRGPVALDGATLRLDDGRPVVVGLGQDALPFAWRP